VEEPFKHLALEWSRLFTSEMAKIA